MGHRSGLPDLVASHADGASARASIERLSRAGVDGGSIRLLGDVEVVTAGRYGDRQTDVGSSLAIGGRFVRGIVWGGAPGAVFGAGVLALTSSPGPVALASGAGGGAVFGAGIGALVALLAVPTMASSWERTFAPLISGVVLVGVRVDDRRTARRARRALRSSGVGTIEEVADLDDLDVPPPGIWTGTDGGT